MLARMKVKGVLITGGCGFIGSHLAEYYLNNDVPVVCVDNFCTGMRSHLDLLRAHPNSKNFVFTEADVTQPWTWAKIWGPDILGQISHVFHLASPASPPHYQAMAFETLWVNSLGLKNALDFSDSVGARLVFSSTSEIYGDPNISPQPESYWGNVNTFGIRSCYDEAKRFGESLIYTHNWKKKTKHGLVRIFNTYGPRMNPNDGRVVVNLLQQAKQGDVLTIYGDGKQTRSFCFVTDLIAGLTRYAETDLTEPVNIGNNTEFTILQLVEEIKNLFPGRELKIEFSPLPKDDPKQRCPDLTKAKKLLAPWQPQVSLGQGLKMMLESLSS